MHDNLSASQVKRSFVLLVLMGGCLGSAPSVPPPAGAEPELVEESAVAAPAEIAWTAKADVAVHLESGVVTLPRPVTRLDVLARDSLGMLQVRCPRCDPPVEGTVAEGDVVYRAAMTPDSAANGSFVEFVLALRNAAAWHRLDELAPVMAPDFTYGLSGQRDRGIAFTAWERENFRSLDQLPRLIDEGLSEIGEDFWVAPVEYAERPNYQGLRAGLRRDGRTGRWEWLFLVRGDV